GLGVAIGILSLAFVRYVALAAAVLFLVGVMQIVFQNTCNTIVQVTVPDELRGRVMGVYMMVFAGATPVGASLIGAIAEGAGVPAACLTGAASPSWGSSSSWRDGAARSTGTREGGTASLAVT